MSSENTSRTTNQQTSTTQDTITDQIEHKINEIQPAQSDQYIETQTQEENANLAILSQSATLKSSQNTDIQSSSTTTFNNIQNNLNNGSFPLVAVLIPSIIAGILALILLILIIRKFCFRKHFTNKVVDFKPAKNIVIVKTLPANTQSAQNIHGYYNVEPQMQNLGTTPKQYRQHQTALREKYKSEQYPQL